MAVANIPDEPQEGGYEYDFVDKVPERLRCSLVCHKVLRDSRLLVCCGKHICETCLNRWLKSQGKPEKKCPHCRQNLTHVKDLSVIQEINDLKIRCTNSLVQPPVHIPLPEVFLPPQVTLQPPAQVSHLFPSSQVTHQRPPQEVPHLYSPLQVTPHPPPQGMPQLFSPLQVTHHPPPQEMPHLLRGRRVDFCAPQERKVAVAVQGYNKGCTWVGALSNLKTHLESEKGCGFVEVHCTNKCKKQLLRKHLADHLTQHCPLRQYNCQYCGKEDTYQTITEKHYDKCPSYPLDCPNKCVVSGIKQAEMSQHRSTCPLEPVECLFKEAGCQAKLVRRELDSHMTANQQQHLLTLMAAFREVKEDFSAVKEAMKVIAADVAIIQQSPEKQSSDLTLASINSQLEITDNSFRLKHGGPPLTIRMINFSHYKRSGKVWHSPPFYYDDGYKMQLAVYANGIGAGASTHVSIALLLMKGEFDHQLRWPVRGLDLQLCIVSQKTASKEILGLASHVVCPCRTPSDRFQRVLEGEGVREVGKMEEFVDHVTLSSKGLVNDSIVLEIEVCSHDCHAMVDFTEDVIDI